VTAEGMRAMRMIFRTILVLAVVALMPVVATAGEVEPADGKWWYVPYPEPFDASNIETNLQFLSVEGNRFVNEDGETVVLFGVNISDPDKLEKNGKWSKAHFEVIKSWGAELIRVPVHPVAWKGRGKAEYFKLLDQAVTWALELDLYLNIEWHGIGNLKTEVFQHPMHYTTRQETYNFWRDVSFRYSGIPAVAFYELFNEPTMYNKQLGSITWAEWKEIIEQMITIIFAHDTKVIPLVGGFNWAYELHNVGSDPIGFEGIGYVSHPYPMKAQQPWEANWEKDFGYVADTYPLMAAEIGFMAAEDPGAHIPVISDENYGRRILAYFDKKGISWTVWCFDPDWPPQMISDWDYTPTTQGAFFRAYMLEHQ
jgi:endoglucanase